MVDVYHPFLDDASILATSMSTPTMQQQAATLHQYDASLQGIPWYQTPFDGAGYPFNSSGFIQPQSSIAGSASLGSISTMICIHCAYRHRTIVKS